MPIIISHKDQNAIRVEQSIFAQEIDLQKYIEANPESIPMEDIKENVQFLILDREFPVSVGSIDALGVDSDGDLYIIETKLYKNRDKRQVVAQVLDYGASLWTKNENPEDWIRKLEKRLSDKGLDLRERLEGEFGQSDQVIEGMMANLSAGAFKFIVLMDMVPSALKDLILYINQNSSFSVFGVELEYYVHGDIKILIPHVFGTEYKRKTISTSDGKRTRWDEISYFQNVETHVDREELAAVRKLYDYSVEIADEVSWGTGSVRGSFNPKINTISNISIYTVFSNGNLQFHYDWMDENEATRRWRDNILEGLRSIAPINRVISQKQSLSPEIPPAAWTPVVEELIEVLGNSFKDFLYKSKVVAHREQESALA